MGGFTSNLLFSKHYLEYLGKLCELMQKKYNEEYVWGDRSLQEDAKQ